MMRHFVPHHVGVGGEQRGGCTSRGGRTPSITGTGQGPVGAGQLGGRGPAQVLRRRTRSTVWSGPFMSTRVARERVGRMFSRRFGALIVSQISSAVAIASSSESEAYRWKYDSGCANAVVRSVRKRSDRKSVV